MNAYIWGNVLPLATFIASLALLFVSLRRKWPVEVPAIEPLIVQAENIHPVERTPFKERVKLFLIRYRWELILGGTIVAILLFALIFAPPRINGKIAIYPHSDGRPFYSLRWMRDFLSAYYDTVRVVCGAILSIGCLLLQLWVIRKRSGLGAQLGMLCASLNLAAAGQWLLHEEDLSMIGTVLYFIALYGFAMWAWAARKRLANDFESKPVARTVEVLVILGLFLLTSFNRLYALRTIPYGIEGDEAKWTSEAVNLGIRGVPDANGEYHRDALPVSYYLQVPLHRLLGPSLFAARLTVAILSIFATLLFYWLLRQITVMPIAAIAAYFLSISIFDISASRLANVESFVKIWPILGLALLALAVRMRRWQVYGLSGLALALGMLTYDTVWPLFAITLIVAIIELARQKEKTLASSSSIAALIAPTLLALPVLIPYLTSRLSYYEFDEKSFSETGTNLVEHFGIVIRTWFVNLNTDFLYNRPGPLLNALLLPFLVLGFEAAFCFIKKKISYWTLLWAGLVIFPVPILANSPMGRVYYPALPAVYTLVALGTFLLWKEIDRFFGANLRPLLIAVALVPCVWLPFANLFIYFNEVSDDENRLMRREIGEIAAQVAGEGTLILLPATPGTDTPLNNEYQMLELYMMQKIPSNEIDTAYRHIAPEELMTSIKGIAANYQKLEIIFDKNESDSLDETLQVCYPQGTLTEGIYFSRFSLNSSATQQTKCNFSRLNIKLENQTKLNWEMSDGATDKLDLLCDVRQAEFTWLETEDSFMGNGWRTEIEFAPGWTGKGFAMDNYESGVLPLEIYFDQPQNTYFWVRYFQRIAEDTSMHLSVDEDPYPFANIQKDKLDRWIWERIGPATVDVDSHITISRSFTGDPQDFMAFFIDSLVTTTDPEFSPEDDIWKSMPPKIYSLEQAQSSGSVSLNLTPAYYRCKLSTRTDIPVIDQQGNSTNNLESNILEIDLR